MDAGAFLGDSQAGVSQIASILKDEENGCGGGYMYINIYHNREKISSLDYSRWP